MFFVTGVTGLCGSYLTDYILERDDHVRVLARGQQNNTAVERVAEVGQYHGWDPCEISSQSGPSKPIDVRAGNLCSPRFGMSQTEWESAADGVDTVFHAAALTDMSQDASDATQEANVTGTKHALEFARQAGARFLHISSAYAAGCRDGRVLETDITEGDDFRNPYERSKRDGEQLVTRYCREHGIPYCIFRPSILCGNADDGRTFRFTNVYAFLRALWITRQRKGVPTGGRDAAQMLELWKSEVVARPLRIEGDPETTTNIVPIDWAIEMMWRIAQNDACLGRTFHIANPHPPTNEDLRTMYQRIYSMEGMEFVARGTLAKTKVNPFEDGLYRGTVTYHPYMYDEPEFDLTNTTELLPEYVDRFPRIDEDYFRRLLIYAVDVRWGKSAGKPVQPKQDPDIAFADIYFSQFLPQWLNQQLLENLRKLNAEFRIIVSDEDAPGWRLCIANGALTSVSTSNGPVACTYRVNPAAFRQIVGGRLAPQQAFFERNVEIEGKIETGLRVATVLADFFKHYPFTQDEG